ncbi:unnamed protein product, partial [Phaeothamnion confervicola]
MWSFFGGSKPTPLEEAKKAVAEAEKQAGGGGGGKGNEKAQYSGSGFDPTGLERAAKAARELERSPNSARILELVREQEAAKAEEHRAKASEYEAYVKQQELERVKEEAEEARRTLLAQTEQSKKVADYQDQLERRRYIDTLNAERHMREREAARQEELVQRQEAIRRKTLEYEATLREQTELARVKAETEGRIRQERQNHDLRLEEARLGALEYRDTVLEGIKLAGETLGKGVREFLGDRERMAAATATVTALAVGIYTAKVGTGVAGRYVEARLGKPSLVRETSRRTVGEALRRPLPTLKRMMGLGKASGALEGVVLEPGLERRLQRVAQSTFNTKRNAAPFRHLLLYGPPGTGKTLFAKGLARHSGLEYAIMTGGDIAPLGRDAVTEMHKLFDWAQTSRRGLLLFVDEADAFLRRRSTEHISEDLRNALNAFLYRTGEATDKFMLVYASNQPEQFDWAVNDRIDEMVPFGLPGRTERLRMINLYMQRYILGGGGGARPITVEGVEDQHIEAAADRTAGFSGREIAKLAIAWQAAAYGNARTAFDVALMEEVLETFVQQKKQKDWWLNRARAGGGGGPAFLPPALAVGSAEPTATP